MVNLSVIDMNTNETEMLVVLVVLKEVVVAIVVLEEPVAALVVVEEVVAALLFRFFSFVLWFWP
jgi:hypothetical protein